MPLFAVKGSRPGCGSTTAAELARLLADEKAESSGANLPTPFTTGLASLDEVIGGWRAGDSVFVHTASPADATWLAYEIIQGTAGAGHAVAVLTLRLSRQRFFEGLAARFCEQTLAELPLLLNDRPSADLVEMGCDVQESGLASVKMILVEGADTLTPNAAAKLSNAAKELQVPAVGIVSWPIGEEPDIAMQLDERQVYVQGQGSARLLWLMRHPRVSPCGVLVFERGSTGAHLLA